MSENSTPRPKRGILLIIILTALLAAGGFLASYMGFFPPERHPGAEATHAEPSVAFIDLPPVVTSVTGRTPRNVMLAAKLEVPVEKQAEVEALLPRVSDAVTSFISGIDAAAFEKRGILEIIRTELNTRANYVLGDGMVNDLLITEFSVR